MGRVAGDDPGYTFRLCRFEERDPETVAEKLAGQKIRKWIPTDEGFEMVSVSTFLGDVMGKPAGAMAWWGYRIGLDKIAELLGADPVALIDLAGDADALEAFLKEHGVNPNMKTEEAGDRGSKAHEVLELLALTQDGGRSAAEELAVEEEGEHETRYGWAVIDWWDERIQPGIEAGAITQVLSEVPVWSIRHWYAGTFDLAIEWGAGGEFEGGWEVLDLKTHKPASGFTKDGKGPAYIADVAQIRAYRMAFEEMGLGKTIGQRTVIARDREYKGRSWLEDTREVPESFVLRIREAYDVKQTFERGEDVG